MSLLQYKLEDGSTVEFEVIPEPAHPAGVFGDQVGKGDVFGGQLAKAKEGFEGSLASLRKAAWHVLGILRGASPDQPSEIDISFGMKASPETNGFVVAKTSTDAHFSVKLTWKK